jgi:hypothetical protein
MKLTGVVRLGWGAVLLANPVPVLRWVEGGKPDHRAAQVARVLGARQVVQAVLQGRDPHRVGRWLGAGVDLTHAASMVLLARADPARRRLALTDATIASAFALAGSRPARGGRARR